MDTELAAWCETLPVEKSRDITILVHPFFDRRARPSYWSNLKHTIPRLRTPLLIVEDRDIEKTKELLLTRYELTTPHHFLLSRIADSTLQDRTWNDVAETLLQYKYNRAILCGGYFSDNSAFGCVNGVREALRNTHLITMVRRELTYHL